MFGKHGAGVCISLHRCFLNDLSIDSNNPPFPIIHGDRVPELDYSMN
jgi:hypothetical protein